MKDNRIKSGILKKQGNSSIRSSCH